MSLQMDSEYTPEQQEALKRAVDEANRVLTQMWDGAAPKYHVAYIELGASHYDERRDQMVTGREFLAADARSG